MRFAYDDSYHIDLSILPYKVLCDDHAGCLGIGQDQTSMSIRISGHERYNRKIRIIYEGLMATKDYLMIMWTLPGK